MGPISRLSSRWLVLLPVVLFALTSIAQTVRYSVTPIVFNSDPTIFVYAPKINNRGYVVAWARPRGAPQQGFIWKDGQIVATLPALGGTCSSAWGLNDAGHVAGSSCLPGDTVRHAVLWRRQRLIDLGIGGPDTGSSATQISERDDLAGGYSRSDGTIAGFFWRRGVSTDLGSLGGPNMFLSGISQAGAVTGQADISDVVDPRFGMVPYHAFLWAKGNLSDLGQIFGADFDTSNGMNRAGEIGGGCGSYRRPGGSCILVESRQD